MVVPFKAWLASRDPNSSPQMMVVKHSDGSDVKVKKSYTCRLARIVWLWMPSHHWTIATRHDNDTIHRADIVPISCQYRHDTGNDTTRRKLLITAQFTAYFVFHVYSSACFFYRLTSYRSDYLLQLLII